MGRTFDIWFFQTRKCVILLSSVSSDSMLKTQVQDLAIPRASLEKPRRSVSLPLPSPVDVNGFSRKSCSYSKLPEEPIKLTVQKLDGSSFDVEVIRSATIAELKLAVQHVFSHMPKNGPGKISWPHVWGHFCLCYDGLELLTETDHMMNYGIKDGDQVCTMSCFLCF
ncbi:U11/U12 small nuclear ribonucleoprotein 25 kDa protein-like [Hibiscus syriacus]|uniref:U11/U12 small nuclear ribonucleoprotein 25 kDa protein-like n=1 Tax=Hibiscus syriacus TaxID=106335 RepID=UPI0019249BC1|nr:U11/U12 small nuclear ribonucleoprotein 25 kDa protein-like [Hibiscus syriacus]